MRKRTVKNLCKEIFWHIVYFLPIIIALFSMLLFTTESYANGIVSSSSEVVTEEDITDLTDTTWLFNERLIIDNNDNGYFINSFNLDFQSNGYVFDIFEYGYDLDGKASYQLVYTLLDYNSILAYDTYDGLYWDNDEYRIITILGGADVTNPILVEFLSTNAVQESVVVDSNGSVYDLMIDSFNSSFEVMGLNFENDYLFNGLNQVFVNGGILSVFKDTSILLKFACYYFYVHIIHLFIDCLLFILNMAHKWIDKLTGCE